MAIRIFIDQGHNPSGPNTGASGNGLDEADITYKIGRYLFDLLLNNGSFTPRLSRSSSSQIIGTSNAASLAERVRDANNWRADYFISIHTNASVNSSAKGTEAFVYRTGNRAYPLAADMVNEIVRRMGTVNRGVKENPTLYVLRKTSMPAVLMETAFISNPSDASLLSRDPYGFAYAMYRGILKYFNML